MTAEKGTLNILKRSNVYRDWDKIDGNRVSLEYYTGVEVGNPSGETCNIKYIKYEQLRGNNTDYTIALQQELTYDSDDNLLTITPVEV